MSPTHPGSPGTPEPGATTLPPDLRIDPRPVAHLPLVRAIIDKLQIRDVIDELVPMDPRSRVSEADCVTLMLLNVLEGRVALYNMADWLGRTDWEVVLGEDCHPAAFNDARLAACLDRIAKAGTEEVLSGVVQRYLRREDAPSTYSVHGDTTSFKLQGAYAAPHQQHEPLPAHGYSKDHRPDLKQLVFGLSLHGSVGIPLTSAMFSGNTSDHSANRLNLDQLGDLLPSEDEVTIVADCKLVDGQTLGQLLLHEFHFVSLLPANFNLRAELIEEVRLAGEEMPELLHAPGRTKADPPRIYRGRSVRRLFQVGFESEGANRLRDAEFRFLVVESSQRTEQEEAGIERQLARERKSFAKAFKKASATGYACMEDAQEAIVQLARPLRYHEAHIEVRCERVPRKRTRRGRPPANEPRIYDEVHRLEQAGDLVVVEEAVERLRFHARHYVLVTSHLDEEQWPDQRVLEEYRYQHVIEGHAGFRWLKNVATVAPVFLHTPRRIAALGLVFVLALMVRNYLQFTLRRRLEETGSEIPDRLGKPTRKPTAETAFLPFADITVIRVLHRGKLVERQLTLLHEAVRTVLTMLEVSEAAFTTPRRRGEIRARPPPTSGM